MIRRIFLDSEGEGKRKQLQKKARAENRKTWTEGRAQRKNEKILGEEKEKKKPKSVSTKITPILYPKSSSVTNGASSFIFKSLISPQNANFTSLVNAASPAITTSQWISKKLLLEPQRISSEQIRTIIKFSWKKGKRKTNKAVVKRFFRLHWGIWIRTMAGRHKKLWKKSKSQRKRLLNHVLCNATQSRLLDTMVNKFWRKPRYYIEDPYEPYHKRENFYQTQQKPWRPEGVDYE